MSLGDKTHALISAAGSEDTTPEKMKSMIDGVKSDPELVHTGAVLPMLQLALQAALTPGNDDDSERRLGVIRAVVDALAEDCARKYVRTMIETRGNNGRIIDKIFD